MSERVNDLSVMTTPTIIRSLRTHSLEHSNPAKLQFSLQPLIDFASVLKKISPLPKVFELEVNERLKAFSLW